MKKNIIFAIFALVLLAISACQVQVTPSEGQETFSGETYDPNVIIKTNSFSSEEEYISFVKNHEYTGMYYGGGPIRGGMEVAVAFDMAESGTSQKASAPSGGTGLDYSGTNVQVAGVDEGDILKTDGEYIYTITDRTLFIVKAYPGQDAEVIATLELEDIPKGIFVNGDKLALFGDLRNANIFAEEGIRIRSGMTFLNIYDITDRSSPSLVKEFRFEGRYHNSRMIGEDMYIISNVYPEYRVDFPTPIIMEGDSMLRMPVSDIHFFNIPYRNPSFVGIHSVNIDSDQKTSSKMIAVEGHPNLYMSGSSLFITYTESINEWELREEIIKELIHPVLPEFYKQLIIKVENTDSDVLSIYEKKMKIQEIYYEYMSSLTEKEQESLNDDAEDLLEKKLNEYEYFEYTVINKINADDGKIEVEANGKAPGRVLNQFSMDEHENVFRIATTISGRWSRFGKEMTESTNNVYTFNHNLNMLGKIEGLAEGESIFSARFMGDRLYMVTFRQVDPFFAIDLSNPSNPKMLGELKIPGFSRYLHPYDENTIIGIGRDATDQGRQLGLKISLFDVSDVSNPVEIAKYVSDDRHSQSAAEWEHKAFLFSKEKNLLVIPASNYNWEKQSENYNGALVFSITKNSISTRGLIDHGSAINNWYMPGVERSLYIEELLYTKSPNLLRINSLDDLNSIKDVPLMTNYKGNIPVY